MLKKIIVLSLIVCIVVLVFRCSSNEEAEKKIEALSQENALISRQVDSLTVVLDSLKSHNIRVHNVLKSLDMK